MLPNFKKALVSLLLVTSVAWSQRNPSPFLSQPLFPDHTVPGASAFTLTLNGSGFIPGSVVNWNSVPRATTYVNGAQLTAAILAADVASPGTGTVTVVNPGPGGGVSNADLFTVANPLSGLAFNLSSLPLGNQPAGMVAGDFNGDGKMDLAVLDSGVTVFLSNGDGTFQNVKASIGLTGVTGLAAGDFNGDGRLDLFVIGGFGASSSYVLLGQGDGTFLTPLPIATPAYGVQVVAGDFNNDGKLDVVVLSGAYSAPADQVSLLVGNGNGTFQPYVTLLEQAQYSAVAAGDFNRDGNLDLAVTEPVSPDGYSHGYLYILLGNGAGKFNTINTYQPADNIYSLNVADINGDGKLDVVFQSNAGQYYPNEIAVMLGKGDGTLGTAIFSTSPFFLSTGQMLAVGDLNGDGKPDLMLYVFSAIDIAGYLLGNGDGTFQAAIALDPPASNDAYSGYPVVADFNGDGLLDVAFAVADDQAPYASILLQSLGPAASLPTVGLVFPNQPVSIPSSSMPATLTNSGNAPLSISSVMMAGENPGDFAQTNDCPVPPATLAASASCTINVVFDPTTTGVRFAYLSVADNASGSPQEMSLEGTGVTPTVSLSTTSLTFRTQLLNMQSAPQSVTLTNTGTVTLAITSILPSDTDFHVQNTCGSLVYPGFSCTISAIFRPAHRGLHTGVITISDNASGPPQTISVSGSGTVVELEQHNLDFGGVSVGETGNPLTVTLTDTSNLPLTFTAISITGTDPGDFNQTNTCGTGIAAGANCVITITFTPTSRGTRTAMVSIADNGGGSPQMISLRGTGR